MTRATALAALALFSWVGGMGSCCAQAIDVRVLGALGDGKADDTAAFVKAAEQARAERRGVFVPRGLYRLARPVVLDGVALTGPEGAAWNADVDAQPVLVPTHRDGPAVELKSGGGLRGVTIRYEWPKEPETGPPAVLVSGVGAFVSNAKIMYPWDGIVTDGISNVGRLNVENVFIVSPRNVGVRVTGTWDVPALRNVEVWNAGPVERGLSKGVGFDLGKNDLIRLSDCFAFAMATGFLLRDEIPGAKIKGGTWGTMANCATDFCGVGILVRGEHTVSITGGTFWDHHEGLLVEGEKARVRLNGAEVRSNGAPAIRVQSADHVVVTGCSVLRQMEGHHPPTVELTGGRTVLQGNVIDGLGVGVRIGPGVKAAELSGNLIEAAAHAKIDDQRGRK